MIASMRGRLRRKLEDRVVVEAAGVGYEVFIPPVVQRALADADGGRRGRGRRGAADGPLPRHPEPAAARPDRLHLRARQGVLREAHHRQGRGAAGGGALARRAGRRDRRRHRAPGRGLPAAPAGHRARRRPRTSSPSSRPRWRSSPWPSPRPRLREARPGRARARGRRRPARHWSSRCWSSSSATGRARRPSSSRGALTRRPGITTPEELFDEIYRGAAAELTARDRRGAGDEPGGAAGGDAGRAAAPPAASRRVRGPAGGGGEPARVGGGGAPARRAARSRAALRAPRARQDHARHHHGQRDGRGHRDHGGPVARARRRPHGHPHQSRRARRAVHRRDPPAARAWWRSCSTRRWRTSRSTS